MRRWLGLALAVLLFSAGCSPDDDSGGGDDVPTPTETTGPDVVGVISDWISQRLQTYSSGPSAELACPPPPPPGAGITVTPYAASGNRPNFGYCHSLVAVGPAGSGQVAVRLRNEMRVPMRFGTSLADQLIPALEPGEMRDVLLPGYPQVRNFTLHYAADVQGAAYLLADEVLPKPPAVQLGECVVTLTLACLVAGLRKVAPQEVTILGHRIPLRRIVDVLATVLTVASVADRWSQLQENVVGGELAFTVR